MEFLASVADAAGKLSVSGVSDFLDEKRAEYYPKNDTEKRVYEALGSQNWGASTTLMQEIAEDTFQYDTYDIVMKLLWDNCLEKQDSKSWKQLFKGLTLLEYLIKNGAERLIESSRDRLYRIRQLEHYNYYEDGNDKGSGVREMATKVIEILGDNDRIREERDKAKKLRAKFSGSGSTASSTGGIGGFGGRGNSGGFGSRGYDSQSNDRDRFDDARSRQSNRNTGGGRYDSNSYSDGGIGSSNSATGRYSDRIGNSNYSNSNDNSHSNTSGNESDRFTQDEEFGREDQGGIVQTDGHDEFDDAQSSSKFKTKNSSSTEKKGKKINIKMKKVGKASTSGAAAAPQVDLLGGLLDSNNTATTNPANSAPAFDAFGQGNNASIAAPPQAGNGNTPFDPFGGPSQGIQQGQGMATMAPQNMQQTGMMGMMPPQQGAMGGMPGMPNAMPGMAPQGMMGGGMPNAMSGMPNPMMNGGMQGGMQQTMNPAMMHHQQQQMMMNGGMQGQAMNGGVRPSAMGGGNSSLQQQMAQGVTSPSKSAVTSRDSASNDFGDFASADDTTMASANGGKKSALHDDSLVNLSNLTVKEDPKKAEARQLVQQQYQASTSFSGIDGGFSKPQSMSNGVGMGGSMPQRSMGSMGGNGLQPTGGQMGVMGGQMGVMGGMPMQGQNMGMQGMPGMMPQQSMGNMPGQGMPQMGGMMPQQGVGMQGMAPQGMQGMPGPGMGMNMGYHPQGGNRF